MVAVGELDVNGLINEITNQKTPHWAESFYPGKFFETRS